MHPTLWSGAGKWRGDSVKDRSGGRFRHTSKVSKFGILVLHNSKFYMLVGCINMDEIHEAWNDWYDFLSLFKRNTLHQVRCAGVKKERKSFDINRELFCAIYSPCNAAWTHRASNLIKSDPNTWHSSNNLNIRMQVLKWAISSYLESKSSLWSIAHEHLKSFSLVLQFDQSTETVCNKDRIGIYHSAFMMTVSILITTSNFAMAHRD